MFSARSAPAFQDRDNGAYGGETGALSAPKARLARPTADGMELVGGCMLTNCLVLSDVPGNYPWDYPWDSMQGDANLNEQGHKALILLSVLEDYPWE